MALPVITSIAPISGPAAGGTIVTLTGTGFTGALAVGFGSTNASALTVISDTTMVAVSPPGMGTVNVTVVTPGGMSAVNAAVQFGYAGGTSNGSTSYYVDPALTSQIVGSLINLVQANNSPDAIAAQSILMRRLALEGDVVGSRIPPPKNISEIGGYLNLLGTLGETAMREQTLAGVLGVAGPTPALGFQSAQPLSMVSLPNDRPAGTAQPSLPLSILVRSDFSNAFLGAMQTLHAQGAMLPCSGPAAIALPPGGPGSVSTLRPLAVSGSGADACNLSCTYRACQRSAGAGADYRKWCPFPDRSQRAVSGERGGGCCQLRCATDQWRRYHYGCPAPSKLGDGRAVAGKCWVLSGLSVSSARDSD